MRMKFSPGLLERWRTAVEVLSVETIGRRVPI